MIYENKPWWDAHNRDEAPHQSLTSLVETFKTSQSTFLWNTRKLIAMFEWGTRRVAGPMSDDTWANTTTIPLDESINTYNHAQNTIETMHSKICKVRIIPMALTEGGNWFERDRAKKLSRALEGEGDESSIDQIKEDVVMDALVTDHGAGCAKVCSVNGKVSAQHIPIEDIFFDEAEVRYRKPQCLYQRMIMDRFVALDMFAGPDTEGPGFYGTRAEREKIILRAQKAPRTYTTEASLDQIEVWEAYRLPTGCVDVDDDGTVKDSKGGRHTIILGDGTMLDEPWTRDTFPFSFYVPRLRRRSVWGLSVMRCLAAPQREHDRVTYRIQKAVQKMAGSHIIASRQANVNPREIDNDAGTFFEYDGQIPPMTFNPSPIDGAVFQYRNGIPNEMRQSVGMNDMSTTGVVPAGLSSASGKALTVFEDQENQRLKPYHNALERWFIKLWWLMVDEARDIAKRDGEYCSKYVGKNSVEKLKWKEILKDKADFVLKVFPIGQLSQSPPAKFAQLEQLLNAGVITTEQFARLYGLPDVEEELELQTAGTQIILKNLDYIIMTGKYVSPSPFDNLTESVRIGNAYYAKVRLEEGIPPERVALVMQYVQDSQYMIDDAKGPPPGPEVMPMDAAPPMPEMMPEMPSPDMMPPDAGMVPAPIN